MRVRPSAPHHDALDLVGRLQRGRGGGRRAVSEVNPADLSFVYCSNVYSPISSSVARPGPGSLAPVCATLLGFTHAPAQRRKVFAQWHRTRRVLGAFVRSQSRTAAPELGENAGQSARVDPTVNQV